MRNILLFILIPGVVESAFSQNGKEFTNAVFLKKLNNDPSYSELKKKIVTEFASVKPGQWGEFVNGVNENIITQNKYIAFTFDACGGKKGVAKSR